MSLLNVLFNLIRRGVDINSVGCQQLNMTHSNTRHAATHDIKLYDI